MTKFYMRRLINLSKPKLIFIIISWAILVFLPVPSQAGKNPAEVKISPSIYPGLHHFLDFVDPGKNVTFDPGLVARVMEFIETPKDKHTLYFADDMLAMARELSRLPVAFLKIHQLQVIQETPLAGLYGRQPFPTFGYEEYLKLLADFLELLSPDIIIQRLFASAPEDILIAPVWNRTRSRFLLDLDAYMEKRDSWQGKMWRNE